MATCARQHECHHDAACTKGELTFGQHVRSYNHGLVAHGIHRHPIVEACKPILGGHTRCSPFSVAISSGHEATQADNHAGPRRACMTEHSCSSCLNHFPCARCDSSSYSSGSRSAAASAAPPALSHTWAAVRPCTARHS